MKPNTVLLNASRGPIVDEKALIEALRSKQIAGAGLDVFEKEPISTDNPLLEAGECTAHPPLSRPFL